MISKPGVESRGGIITEKNPDLCTVRLRLPAGVLSAEQIAGVARIAQKYGSGDLHITTRQALEISHVHHRDLEAIVQELEENQTPLGAEREEVVNVVACPGDERCKVSNIDSIALAKKIDEKHFGRDMPVKVRVGISACPNSCAGEQFNEIGITGTRKPVRDPGLCTGCGTCVGYCRENAIEVRNGAVKLDKNKCIECGACVQTCPYGILTSEPPAYRISVGGRRGRHPSIGRPLITVHSSEAALEVVDRVMDWIYRYAWTSGLLADQMDNLGFDSFRDSVRKDLGDQSENPVS